MADTLFEPPAWPDGSRWLVHLPRTWTGERNGDLYEFKHLSGEQSISLGVSKAAAIAGRTPEELCLGDANTRLFGALYACLPLSWQLRAAKLTNPVFLLTTKHPSLGYMLGRLWCRLVRAQIRQRAFGASTGCVLERSVGGKFVAEGYLRAMDWRFWIRYIAAGGPETLTRGSAHDVLAAIRFPNPNAL